MTATFTVTNAGGRPGADVPQVYLTEARARASTPLPSTIAQDLVLDAKATLVERPSGRER